MPFYVMLVFNGTGFIISAAAIIVVVHAAIKIVGPVRSNLFSLVKGFVLIALSFLWTLLFGQFVMPVKIWTIQSIVLSLGMALLIFSANKLFEIHDRSKEKEV